MLDRRTLRPLPQLCPLLSFALAARSKTHHTNPRFSSSDVLQHRADPGPALLPQSAMKLSAPTPTRTTPPPLPHPGASRPTPNQHHPRKKEPSATSTAVRASPVRFACQSKYRGQHAPRYHLGADSTARFECLCIQWRRRTMDAGIPPLLTSFEACFGNWHGRDLQSLCCLSRIEPPDDKIRS